MAASMNVSGGVYTLRWVTAWAAALLLLNLAIRTRAGYAAAYYLAVLMLVFLLLSQYRAITTIFRPITG